VSELRCDLRHWDTARAPGHEEIPVARLDLRRLQAAEAQPSESTAAVSAGAIRDHNPEAKPRLADFAKLSIRHSVRIGWRASELERRVHAVETSSQHLKRMRVEIVGSLVVDRERVKAEFTPGEPPITVESNFANKARIDRPGNEDPRVEDPIAAYLT
jgi:hypothetical protein